MISSPSRFSVQPSGPFDLALQSSHFGDWLTPADEPGALVLAFPVEGSAGAAAVVLRQDGDGLVTGEVYGCRAELAGTARAQTLAALSLDVDGSGWPAVGERDPRLGELQERYGFLRPVLFHSPYEAAAAFVIGHRISIKQTRALRARLAEEIGGTVTIGGQPFHAFPTPQELLAAPQLPGISAVKHERLRAVAGAAQDGWLCREPLRALPADQALQRLQTLPGIGAFFAQGILYRGAGLTDGLTDDDVTRFALSERYGVDAGASPAAVRELTERWRPYRMWANVLMHVWVRSEVGLPPRAARRSRARA